MTYELWIETANSKEMLQEIQNYFKEIGVIKTEMGEYPISVNHYCLTSTTITVKGISRTGISSKKDEKEMSLIGYEFYKLLRNAPEFRYALTGCDISGCFELEELEEDPSYLLIKPGVVIQKELYERLGAPGNFEEFRQEYVWSCYNGEV